MSKRPPKLKPVPAKDTDRVIPVSNLPHYDSGLPASEKDFYVLKLEYDLKYFKAELSRTLEASRIKDATLLRVQQWLDSGLQYGDWPTLGELRTLYTKIESARAAQGRVDLSNLNKIKKGGK